MGLFVVTEGRAICLMHVSACANLLQLEPSTHQCPALQLSTTQLPSPRGCGKPRYGSPTSRCSLASGSQNSSVLNNGFYLKMAPAFFTQICEQLLFLSTTDPSKRGIIVSAKPTTGFEPRERCRLALWLEAVSSSHWGTAWLRLHSSITSLYQLLYWSPPRVPSTPFQGSWNSS